MVTHVSSHPSCEMQLWWDCCYVMRGRWGETNTQTIVCIFRKDSRGELSQDSLFETELLQNKLLYLIVMLGKRSFTITVSNSHQLYQLKKKKLSVIAVHSRRSSISECHNLIHVLFSSQEEWQKLYFPWNSWVTAQVLFLKSSTSVRHRVLRKT